MKSFLWHRVSEKEKEDIRKQAKKIMDDFSIKLSEVDGKVSESFVEREKGEREKGSEDCLEFDKEIMFENAPSKNKDFIIAEKKGW